MTVRALRYLKIALLLVAYVVVVAIDRLFGRKAAIIALVVVALAGGVLALHGCQETRIATYNIRFLGPETDMDDLVRVTRSVDAELFAIQEVHHPATLETLARRASEGGRSYRALVARCGGQADLRVGFLYDERVLQAGTVREIPEACGDRRGVLTARFTRGSRGFTVIVAHLLAGGGKEPFEVRKEQWRALYRIKDDIVALGEGPVLIVGDMNSTGFHDDAHGERRFIDETTAAASMELASADLACSEYMQTGGGLSPSLLDHVVGSPGLVSRRSVRVHGYCVELACKPHKGAPPREYERVSDHCPVSFAIGR